MSSIIGYSISEDRYFHKRALLALDDELTKAEIVRRGWAVGPLYLPWPLYHTPKDGYNLYPVTNHSAFRDDLERGYTFKYEGQYYTIRGYNAIPSPLTLPYWNRGRGVTNEYAISIIMAALNAPVVVNPISEEPYKVRWTTYAGEQVDMTVWIFNRRVGIPSTLDPDGVYETTKIPGVGYASMLKDWGTLDHEEEKAHVGYPISLISILEKVVRQISFVVHYPNCELGNDVCASYDVEPTVDDNKNIMSVKVKFKGLSHAKVRRLIMPRYQPRTATSAISCHVMTKLMAQRFVDSLYTKDVYDRLKTMLYGDGAGNILSLKWFYGVRPNLSTAKQAKVSLGNVVLENVVAPVYNGDFVQVYMGYVKVPREFGDYRDFTNVRYQAYLPMVGTIDLDPSVVVGENLHLLYTVNLTDGSAVVTLAISKLMTGNVPVLPKRNDWYDTPQIVFTSSVTYGYEIPLNVDSIRSPSLVVGDIVTKAVVGGVSGAVAGNYAGAAIGATIGAVAGASGGVETTYSSGSLSPNSNVMGSFVPTLIRTVNSDESGDISAAVGAPSGKVVRVGDASGYLKAAVVYGTPSTTMQHADEIENILKEGIHIS